MEKIKIKKAEYMQEIKDDKVMSYWYGGLIYQVEFDKGDKILVEANGDIDLDIIDSSGNFIEGFKDRNNSGTLEKELGHIIKNDKDLLDMLNEKHDKYSCEITNNNWLEYNYIDVHGDFHDLGFIYDSIIGCDVNEVHEIFEDEDYWNQVISELRTEVSEYSEEINEEGDRMNTSLKVAFEDALQRIADYENKQQRLREYLQNKANYVRVSGEGADIEMVSPEEILKLLDREC